MQQEHHKQVADFLKSGDYQSAINFLEEIEEKAKDDPDYWYYLALISRKIGDLQQAEEYCNKALKISPNFRNAVFELGMIYQAKGDYKKAIFLLEEAASAKGGEVYLSEQVDILNSLGLTYKMAGNHKNALIRYNAALEGLATGIYEKIKNLTVSNVGDALIPELNLNWHHLAFQILANNTKNDGLKLFAPDNENTLKLMDKKEGSPVFYDKDGMRYLFPAYYVAFCDELRANIYYSNILNNIGALFAEIGETEKAKKIFREAIDFIPKGVKFDNPYINLENLK